MSDLGHPLDMAELPTFGAALGESGFWIWVAGAWLLWVAAGRRAPDRLVTSPLVVMVWSLGSARGLYRYGLEAPGHGWHQWAFFVWFELVNIAWQGLLLLLVIGLALALDRRAVVQPTTTRAGTWGACAGVAAVIYCWFTLAVAAAGPIVAEAMRTSQQ